MNEAGEQMIASDQELLDFAKGRNKGPLNLYMPDGKDGLVLKKVSSMTEYRALCRAEFGRALKEAATRQQGEE